MSILCPDFQIGTSVATLVLLPSLGVPHPFAATYDEFTVRNVRGDGLIRGDGFPTATWVFVGLTRESVRNLLSLIAANTASNNVFIRTNTNDDAGTMFNNFSAVMARPQLQGTDGTPAEQFIGAFLNVTIRFSRLVAQ